MRFTKLITLAFATAALAVPAATAGDHPNHGKGHAKQRPCKANVAVNLKGTFGSAAADGKSFTMTATRANRHGRPYLKATQPLTINVSDKTKFVKNDAAAKLTDLAANDQVVVKSKACKRDLRNAQTPDALPALTARMVVDQGPAAPAEPAGDH
jgi:hypothetical protein